jgi:hypothetical protein
MQGSFDGEPILPGQTREVGFVFLTHEGAQTIRNARHFFLWEMHIIGEATVCYPNPPPCAARR